MELFSLEEEAAHVAGWPFRFYSPVIGRQRMVTPGKSDALFTVVRYPDDVGAGVSPVREFPSRLLREPHNGAPRIMNIDPPLEHLFAHADRPLPAARELKSRGGSMFCDKCGTSLQTGQRFCPACGKEVIGGTQWEQLRRGRVSAHVRLLAILWLAISAFNTLSGLAVLLVAKPVLLHLRELGQGPPEFVQGFLQPLLTLAAIFLLSKALLGFAAGWGLLRRESWARIVALIGGFLALFHPPFGTALGIYTLWVLLPAESEREYAEQAARAA